MPRNWQVLTMLSPSTCLGRGLAGLPFYDRVFLQHIDYRLEELGFLAHDLELRSLSTLLHRVLLMLGGKV
jgi:hypothetical protein